jgi:Family of unknown function (DUF5681)
MTNNTKKSGKGKVKNPATLWKKGQSGNPYGRPKDNESYSGITRMLSNMTADEIATMVGGNQTDLGRAFVNMPRNVQMKYLQIIRAMQANMFEPQASLLREIIDRVDGKVSQGVEITNPDGSLTLPPEQAALRLEMLMEIAKKRKKDAGRN